MKTRLLIPFLLVLLGSTFATTVVSGQTATNYLWTGAGDGTSLVNASNYSPNGLPSGHGTDGISPGDTITWDGLTTNDLVMTYAATSLPNTGFGSLGLQLVMTANQTNSVQLMSTVAGSANLALSAVTNKSPSATMVFGDGTLNGLVVSARPAGTVHHWVNNSTAPAIINPSVRWSAGGGAAYTMEFGGTGDWIVKSSLRADGGSVTVILDGPGTMMWTNGNFVTSSTLGPVAINGGKVVIQGVGLLPGPSLGVGLITNIGTLIFDAPSQSDTNSRSILGTGLLIVRNGTLTLAGANTYTGGTEIASNARLQVGAGGTYGSVGGGTVTNNGTLLFNRSDEATFTNVISGAGSLVQYGSGSLTLIGANTYSGSTIVSNGTLVINGGNTAAATFVYGGTFGGTGPLSGPVTLDPGTTLAPGASIGTLTINSNLTIGGNVAIEINKALAPSNDFVVVSGTLTNTGTGTLTALNLGPALAVGDKFTLFSKPVQNGAALKVTGAGVNWANNLALDGSITVIPPMLNFAKTGNSLQFSWSGSYKLQSQTNTLSVGLSTNWADYSGSGTSPVTVPIGVTNGAVFFRLIPEP